MAIDPYGEVVLRISNTGFDNEVVTIELKKSGSDTTILRKETEVNLLYSICLKVPSSIDYLTQRKEDT